MRTKKSIRFLHDTVNRGKEPKKRKTNNTEIDYKHSKENIATK